MRRLRNPWINPPPITPEMERLACNLIRDNEETVEFIEEIEGPTEAESIAWGVECAEIMAGIIPAD